MLKSQVVGELFRKHYGDLRAMITVRFHKDSLEAEDVVQDAFHNFLKLEQIDNIENPKAYLFQTASNLALSRMRKQAYHTSYINAQDASAADERTPERAVMAGRDLDQLTEALEQLPAKYRRTFLLSRIEFKTYKEISIQLGIPQSTVEKHMIKTLKYLRDHIGSEVEA